jgi:hypothetical protein
MYGYYFIEITVGFTFVSALVMNVLQFHKTAAENIFVN